MPPVIPIPGVNQPEPEGEITVSPPKPDPGGGNQGQSNNSLIMPPWVFIYS